jgi:hypothetical protein
MALCGAALRPIDDGLRAGRLCCGWSAGLIRGVEMP